MISSTQAVELVVIELLGPLGHVLFGRDHLLGSTVLFELVLDVLNELGEREVVQFNALADPGRFRLIVPIVGDLFLANEVLAFDLRELGLNLPVQAVLGRVGLGDLAEIERVLKRLV